MAMDIADALTRLAARSGPAAPTNPVLARNGATAELDGATASAARSDSLGRDQFLKMLLAQLQNQDPLNPQDATEFTAQLATFSMLEQLMAIQSGIARVERLLEGVLATSEPGGGVAARSIPARRPIATLAPPEGAR